MAPCANCSQTVPNLFRLANAKPPPQILAPGFTPNQITSMKKAEARGEAPPPMKPTRFTPPQDTTPSYDSRLRSHNARYGDNCMIHTYDNGTGWGTKTP